MPCCAKLREGQGGATKLQHRNVHASHWTGIPDSGLEVTLTGSRGTHCGRNTCDDLTVRFHVERLESLLKVGHSIVVRGVAVFKALVDEGHGGRDGRGVEHLVNRDLGLRGDRPSDLDRDLGRALEVGGTTGAPVRLDGRHAEVLAGRRCASFGYHVEVGVLIDLSAMRLDVGVLFMSAMRFDVGVLVLSAMGFDVGVLILSAMTWRTFDVGVLILSAMR